MMYRMLTRSAATVALAVFATAASAVTAAPTTAPAAKTVSSEYPSLASGGLLHAKLADLPKDTLLRAGELVLKEADVAAEIAAAREEMRDQLRKNAFFLLEQMATRKLLVAEAKAALAGDPNSAKLADRELVDAFFGKLAAAVTVSEKEVSDFYAGNKDAVGGASLEQAGPSIRRWLTQQKQQEVANRHIDTLAQRAGVEVAAAWTSLQAAAALDNPVDKARASGKPSLVDFGAKGCIPCDKLAPILVDLRKKYDGKANVIFISVREEPVLAGRYGIQSIPVQIFFDKDGKETFRHTGFMEQEHLEKKLAELGVK